MSSKGSVPHPLLVLMAPKCLRPGLTGAVRDETFSSWLRAEMRRGFADPLVLTFLQWQNTLHKCTSASEQDGLHLQAVSGYVEHASDPKMGKHVFTYNMRFTNASDRSVRVLARQYDFRDGTGALASQIKHQQPEAAGVVGYTPLIAPGSSFEFGSGVVLRTEKGTVTGKFIAMVEPELPDEEEQRLHRKMVSENQELMLRYVYLKGLDAKIFEVPLRQMWFDKDVHCVSSPFQYSST